MDHVYTSRNQARGPYMISTEKSNERGQMVVEMVLMLVVMVGVAVSVASTFRNNEYIAKLVSGPWESLSGLIQNGVWGRPGDTVGKHPNVFHRLNTVRGDELK